MREYFPQVTISVVLVRGHIILMCFVFSRHWFGLVQCMGVACELLLTHPVHQFVHAFGLLAQSCECILLYCANEGLRRSYAIQDQSYTTHSSIYIHLLCIPTLIGMHCYANHTLVVPILMQHE